MNRSGISFSMKLMVRRRTRDYQAEDAYEAISLLRVNVPDASIDGVYVQVELYNDEDEEDNDDGTNE
jgi:hypothetical protein